VTNVTEDGQIPRVPEPNWTHSGLNSFRQNVQPGGLFDAPDFVVREIFRLGCEEGQFRVAMVVGNDGSLSVPPGILTHVVVTTDDARIFDLGTVATTGWLLPGQSEQLEAVFAVSSGPHPAGIQVSATVDADGMGGQRYNECNEDNNAAMSNAITCPSVE